MTGLQIAPVDTLFFRDSTPFAAGSASQEDVGGLFPPHPTTVAGAIRAVLARLNGWNGDGRWPQALNEVLGDGPDDLGQISLTGPFLLHEGRPIFAMPRHLLGATEAGRWLPQVILRPGSAVSCDLGGAVRLPEVPRLFEGSEGGEVEVLKPTESCWLTRRGMEAVLRAELPPQTEVIPGAQLWQEERRVGLERDRGTRTAKEGMLYSTRHVRLMAGVALGVQVTGLPEAWSLPFGKMLSLGGEGRLAECRPWREEMGIDQPLESIVAEGRLVVVAMTPTDLSADTAAGCQPLRELGVRVVSACLGRPQRVGGWDSVARRPTPLHNLLPPGSVLFCEIDDRSRLREITARGGRLLRVGERQQWGYGAVALGRWPDDSEVTS